MVVSDNLKSGMTQACFYDSTVNRSCAEMAAGALSDGGRSRCLKTRSGPESQSARFFSVSPGAFCDMNVKSTLGGQHMKSLAIHAALLAGVGALMFMGTAATTIPAAAECVIDLGNGHLTPCDGVYMKCMVDEGNGRRTPCDAMLKPKKTKKTKK